MTDHRPTRNGVRRSSEISVRDKEREHVEMVSAGGKGLELLGEVPAM
jgi:hypothetical protein